jgi:uncharacterized membrane protein YphA (DoxX/SURF4 family)
VLVVALLLTGRWLLALVLLGAGLAKLADRAGFAQAVQRYAILSPAAVAAVASGLPGVEVVLGVALAAGIAPLISGAGACLLLIGLAAAVAVNVSRGRRFPCGCGPVGGQIGWPLVARDVVLSALAVAVAVGPAGLALLPEPHVGALVHIAAATLLPVPLGVIAMVGLLRCIRSYTVDRRDAVGPVMRARG